MKYITLGTIIACVVLFGGIVYASSTIGVVDKVPFGEHHLGDVYKVYDSADNVVCYVETTSPAISAIGSSSGIWCVKL